MLLSSVLDLHCAPLYEDLIVILDEDDQVAVVSFEEFSDVFRERQLVPSSDRRLPHYFQ